MLIANEGRQVGKQILQKAFETKKKKKRKPTQNESQVSPLPQRGVVKKGWQTKLNFVLRINLITRLGRLNETGVEGCPGRRTKESSSISLREPAQSRDSPLLRSLMVALNGKY